MDNLIIGIIIVAIIGIAVSMIVKRPKGGCCGGGSAPVPVKEKKLSKVVAKRTVKIEGMTCEHCKNRIEKAVNAVDGMAAVVSLNKGQAVVSLEKEVDDATIKAIIEDAGYQVIEII